MKVKVNVVVQSYGTVLVDVPDDGTVGMLDVLSYGYQHLGFMGQVPKEDEAALQAIKGEMTEVCALAILGASYLDSRAKVTATKDQLEAELTGKLPSSPPGGASA